MQPLIYFIQKMPGINPITSNNCLSGTLFAFIIIDKKYRQNMLLEQS
jgi:hypothetical protein